MTIRTQPPKTNLSSKPDNMSGSHPFMFRDNIQSYNALGGVNTAPMVSPVEVFAPAPVIKGPILFPIFKAEQNKIEEFKNGVPLSMSSIAGKVQEIPPAALCPIKDLPAFLHRSQYIADGSKIYDGNGSFYGQGYGQLHFEFGMTMFRVFEAMRPYLTPNDGEKPSVSSSPDPMNTEFNMLDQKSKPTKPLRAFLLKKGVDLSAIPSFLDHYGDAFRNTDFGMKELRAISQLMHHIQEATSGDDFKKFLDQMPKEYKSQITGEPFELYCDTLKKTLQTNVKAFEDVLRKPHSVFIQRVLLEKENNSKLEEALKNLAQLDVIKKEPFLEEYAKKIAHYANDYIKICRGAITQAEQNTFNPKTLLTHITKIPEAMEKLLLCLASISDDQRLKLYPDFEKKLQDLVPCLDSILEGPLRKDLDIWQEAQIKKLKERMTQKQQQQTQQIAFVPPVVPSPTLPMMTPPDSTHKASQDLGLKNAHMNFIAPLVASPVISPISLPITADKIMESNTPKDKLSEAIDIVAKRKRKKLEKKAKAETKKIIKALENEIQKVSESPAAPMPTKTEKDTTKQSKDTKKDDKKKDGKKKFTMIQEDAYVHHMNKMPMPQEMAKPLTPQEISRPAVFDDPYLRSTQNLAEWADYASKLQTKMTTLDNIGKVIHDLAIAPYGRPDPEQIALERRWRRLSDLNDVIQEVPKANRMTRQVELGSILAQREYVKGVGQILSDRFRLQAEEANQKAQLDQMAAKAATGLASKSLETSLIMRQQHEKIFNTFMQITEMRDANTWDRIKRIAKGFKF